MEVNLNSLNNLSDVLASIKSNDAILEDHKSLPNIGPNLKNYKITETSSDASISDDKSQKKTIYNTFKYMENDSEKSDDPLEINESDSSVFIELYKQSK